MFRPSRPGAGPPRHRSRSLMPGRDCDCWSALMRTTISSGEKTCNCMTLLLSMLLSSSHGNPPCCKCMTPYRGKFDLEYCAQSPTAAAEPGPRRTRCAEYMYMTCSNSTHDSDGVSSPRVAGTLQKQSKPVTTRQNPSQPRGEVVVVLISGFPGFPGTLWGPTLSVLL